MMMNEMAAETKNGEDKTSFRLKQLGMYCLRCMGKLVIKTLTTVAKINGVVKMKL